MVGGGDSFRANEKPILESIPISPDSVESDTSHQKKQITIRSGG